MGLDDFLGSVKARTYQTADEREDAAKSLTEKCGYAAAALTIIPIPLSEVVAVTSLHVGMVAGIGHIYGAEVTRDSATQLLLRIGATVGLSIMGTKLATTAAKIVFPFFGGIISAPFMYASTLAIGMVARVYFESQGQVSDDDMKAVYAAALKKAKSNFDPLKAKTAEAADLAQSAAEKAKADPAMAAAEAEIKKPEDPVARLERLKAMKDKGLIDAAEFEATKKRILAEM
jgi:uncharacterized protein (DUF697 family)